MLNGKKIAFEALMENNSSLVKRKVRSILALSPARQMFAALSNMSAEKSS
jgi:hypothetical protein